MHAKRMPLKIIPNIEMETNSMVESVKVITLY